MLADALKSGVAKTLGKTKCPLYVFSGDYDYSASPEMSKQVADQLGGEFVHSVNMVTSRWPRTQSDSRPT